MDDRRLEELTLNSSAPPGQLLYDGWLLRLAPGKAKRARSVNAVYPSSRPLAEKIGYCERLYGAAGLPALFRITPFSEPAALDAALEARGYGRFDFTAVETAPMREPPAHPGRARRVALEAWVEALGSMRASTPEQRHGHLARLRGMPLRCHALAIESGGRIVATGLAIVEDRWAGLFDIHTDEAERRQGHAREMVASLLAVAWREGAREAYLQVNADNEPARRLYRELGFRERYLYWYRGREGEQG